MGTKEVLENFADDPEGYIWGIVLGGIIAGWRAGLDYIAEVGNVLAEAIVASTWGPLQAVGAAARMAIVNPYTVIAEEITAAAVSTGIAAPIAALVGWFLPLVILGFIARQVLNFVDPVGALEDIPYIGDRV